MSQSAVSESILHLESAIRVRLLDRTPQGIEPTIYAETLLKRGHVVFDELQQAIEDIEFLANPTVGEVRIACPEFLTEWLMPTTIDKLSCRFPQIVVRVFQPDPTMEHRELRERSVDIVVTRVPKNFASDIFDIEVLFDDPHFVVAGAESRWAQRGSLRQGGRSLYAYWFHQTHGRRSPHQARACDVRRKLWQDHIRRQASSTVWVSATTG
jgi:DNA-binding transcriptional LysR family regulator